MKKLLASLVASLALAGIMTMAVPADRAAAVSLIGPGSAAMVKTVSETMTTEVRWGRRHFGGGRHFGHRRHFGHHRHFGWRPHFRRHHHWRPPFYYYGGPRVRCHRVWTYYGPRRVCRYVRW